MITIAEALAASHQRASEFTRSLFEKSWTSDQVVDFINRHRNATIATTNPQGQPHAAVVIAGSVNQGIYFTPFDANWASLIIGVMLLLAVLMNNTFRTLALSYASKKK